MKLFLVPRFALVPGTTALAQPFPSKPLRIIVPFTPGSATDTMVRPIADRLGAALACVSRGADHRRGGLSPGRIQFLVQSDEMKDRLAKLGAEPMSMTPEQYDAFLREEFNVLGEVMRASGVKAQ